MNREYLLPHISCKLSLVVLLLLLPGIVFSLGHVENREVVVVESLRGPTGLGIAKLAGDNPILPGELDVEYRFSSAPDVTVSNVLSGEADIAALPTNVAARLYSSGVPYRVLAVNTLGVLYIVSTNPDIEDLGDLEGRELLVSGRGANPDIILQALLEGREIDPEEDLSISYVNHTEAAQLLLSGREESALLPEPFVTRVLQQNPEARVAVDIQDEWQRQLGRGSTIGLGCLVIHERLVEEEPAFVATFLEEYLASIDWVRENPEQAGPIVEALGIGFSAAEAQAAIPRSNLVGLVGSAAHRAIGPYFRALYAFDPASLGGSLPGSDLFVMPEELGGLFDPDTRN
ncbi:MAG: ABC transporter substrate-binding protein [Spirochaetota bacterium]